MARLRRDLAQQHGLTVGVVVVGLGLTVVLTWANNQGIVRNAGELMDRRAQFVTESIRSSVRSTLDDASATAALFRASEEVTEAEFHLFVESTGQHPGALGLAYLPLSSPSEPSFPAEAGSGYELFRFDQRGNRIPAPSGGTSYPVRYFVPVPRSDLDLRGFEAASDPAWAEVLERAADERALAISRLTQLFGVPGQWGFLAVAPIEQGEEVTGFTTSVVLLEALVEEELADTLSDLVMWQVVDVTAGIPALGSPDPLRRSVPLEVGGRVWRVEVVPTEAARGDLLGHAIGTGLLVGTLFTALAALVVHLAIRTLRGRRETRELRRLTEEKDEFLAAISHELRTPLTVVVGMAEILEETFAAGADPEVREYVSLLRQEGAELADLVEDLLLLGRLETRTLPMHPQALDVRWEMDRILTEIEPPSGVRLSISGAGRVWADPLRLRQVVRNLYTNALRHGGEQVSIRIEEDAEEVRVSVADDGAGVPADRLPHLFSASLGIKQTPSGPSSLGLGLRISKRLALALGGDLTYRRVGSETIFELRLPVPKGRATTHPILDERRADHQPSGTRTS